MYNRMVNNVNRTIDFIDFQIPDEKGRSVGARIIKNECDVVPTEKTEGACYVTLEPGHYYELNVHATRNGKRYGACQPDHHYKTDEERTQALEKYLKDAKKRAMKKTTKGE